MPLRLIPDIHRATHRIGLYIEQLDELGVTQAEAHLLSQLTSAGDSTVAELHETFAHKRSTLTSILDRLVARGLVTREVGEQDRRTVVVRLTQSGRPLAARVYNELEKLEKRLLTGVSAARLKELREILARLES